ncbi:MAG: hypothetical protein ACRDMV_13210 [Streptosporangiales bacterium]
MRFIVQGTKYEIPDPDDLTTRELRDIKQQTGMGLRSFGEGLADMDPDSISAVVYLAKKRAGESVQWHDLDDLRPLKDVEWLSEDEQDGEESNPPPEAPADSPDIGTFPPSESVAI